MNSHSIQTQRTPHNENHTPHIENRLPEEYSTPDPMLECQNENLILKKLFKLLKLSYKIPDSLLDDQKKLILNKKLLKEFISQLLNVAEENIRIITSSASEAGCCGMSSMIETIDDIKIKIPSPDGRPQSFAHSYRSFEIFYNEMYNKIIEEFNISLNKVIHVGNN